MAERDLNKRICHALRGLDPVRIESAVGAGVPDINYSRGWIESKQLPELPKRQSTIVAVPHYTPEQRAWHIRRQAAGGTIWVVLDVPNAGETFVWHGREAAQFLGIEWTYKDMREQASLYLPRWDAPRFRAFILVRSRC